MRSRCSLAAAILIYIPQQNSNNLMHHYITISIIVVVVLIFLGAFSKSGLFSIFQNTSSVCQPNLSTSYVVQIVLVGVVTEGRRSLVVLVRKSKTLKFRADPSSCFCSCCCVVVFLSCCNLFLLCIQNVTVV